MARNLVPQGTAVDSNSNGKSEPARLLIRVSTGAGAGSTRLAAFDTALFDAGIAGYNIIRLSSVIPRYAEVRRVSGSDQIQGLHGDVAYCVYATAYASVVGEQAWAGVAWAFHRDGSGAGLFVEHSASSESMLQHDLRSTIETMDETRGRQYHWAGMASSSAVCVDHPVCAIAVATYGTVGWETLVPPIRPIS